MGRRAPRTNDLPSEPASDADHASGREAGWVTAKCALEDVARALGGSSGHGSVGYVKRIGHGLSRDAYAAELSVAGSINVMVALVPGRGTGPDVDARLVHEERVLAALGRLADEAQPAPFPLRFPREARVVRSGARLVLVMALLQGFPLELRAGRQPGIRPWEIVGRVAAAVHTVDPRRLDPPLEGFATRRDHALEELRVLDAVDDAIFRQARAWADANLPPDDPATLLHGDLLGQNILLSRDDSLPPALIDWEYARLGDPAYDLAIVTRGVRRPFQVGGGLGHLLEAYRAAGGLPITRAQVRLHELCLAARWYVDARADPLHEREALALVERVLEMCHSTA